MKAQIRHILRLLHTIRPLRFRQISNRVLRRIYRPWPREFQPFDYKLSGRPKTDFLPRAQSAFTLTEFRFLNEVHSVKNGDWDDPTISKLWRYNLHYFDALLQKEDFDRFALIYRWIDENPAPSGSGWEPYPLSLRLTNWVKFALTESEGGGGKFQASIAQQTDWLLRTLEWHILGNHLFANAKALIFASLVLDGNLRDRALRVGLRIARAETKEQFLNDGGHFELSPMYHSIVLEDVLDLLNVLPLFEDETANKYARRLESLVPKSLAWLLAMTHPDGQIALFNDASFDIAPAPKELVEYAGRLGLFPEERSNVTELACTSMSESGYVRLENGPAVAILDCAEVGASYLPGHAHADTLSFELSVHGSRLIVNGGTSAYGLGPLRLAQRSTAAHSTVVIDGQNSSDVWSGFRVGKRAKSFGLSSFVDPISKMLGVEASHNGYRPTNVTRKWRLCETKLTIIDSIDGGFGSAEAYFHLHPSWGNITRSATVVETSLLRDGSQKVRMEFHGAEEIDIIDTKWHPKFGVEETSKSIRILFSSDALKTNLHWN